jgi:hypothetical protein
VNVTAVKQVEATVGKNNGFAVTARLLSDALQFVKAFNFARHQSMGSMRFCRFQFEVPVDSTFSNA